MAVGNFKLAGMVIGAGAAVIGPKLLPQVGNAAKYAVKSLIKGGLLAYQTGKNLVDDMTGAFENMASEARAELREGSGKGQQIPAKKKAVKKVTTPKKLETGPAQ
jgi:polyhydroxyalkanoate synthesis regulator phasin